MAIISKIMAPHRPETSQHHGFLKSLGTLYPSNYSSWNVFVLILCHFSSVWKYSYRGFIGRTAISLPEDKQCFTVFILHPASIFYCGSIGRTAVSLPEDSVSQHLSYTQPLFSFYPQFCNDPWTLERNWRSSIWRWAIHKQLFLVLWPVTHLHISSLLSTGNKNFLPSFIYLSIYLC